MNFFEYLFCRLYWWYTQIIKEKDVPFSYSIIGLSVFQTYSIFPLYAVIYLLLFNSYRVGYLFDNVNINICLLFNVIMIVVDLIYLKKPKYKLLLKTFDKIPKAKKKKMDICCIVYIIAIIVINVLITIWFRSHNVST